MKRIRVGRPTGSRELIDGGALRYYRMRRKLTARDVAEHLRCSRGAIYDWEACRCAPDPELVPEIARLVGCRTSDLYNRPSRLRA